MTFTLISIPCPQRNGIYCLYILYESFRKRTSESSVAHMSDSRRQFCIGLPHEAKHART